MKNQKIPPPKVKMVIVKCSKRKGKPPLLPGLESGQAKAIQLVVNGKIVNRCTVCGEHHPKPDEEKKSTE